MPPNSTCSRRSGSGTPGATAGAAPVPRSAPRRSRARRPCRSPFRKPARWDSAARADLRRKEADEFYGEVTPAASSEDDRRILRQALAGMLWSKQYYLFDLDRWLREHGHDPIFNKRTKNLRNSSWAHMVNEDIISMPDKWEYPWYATWDLAFHAVLLAMVDLDFA